MLSHFCACLKLPGLATQSVTPASVQQTSEAKRNSEKTETKRHGEQTSETKSHGWETKAARVSEEWITTQQAYVNDLHRILEDYATPVKELGLMTEAESQGIFGNLVELLGVDEVVLEQMRQGGESAALISRIFLKMAPFYKLYSDYCRNYENGLQLLQRCKRNSPKLAVFLSHKEVPLDSLLIKPVQRLLKLPLLFRELLSSIPESHPFKVPLAKASALMEDVANEVNQQMQHQESRVVWLLEHLGEAWHRVLLVPHRHIEREFDFTLRGKSAQELQTILLRKESRVHRFTTYY